MLFFFFFAELWRPLLITLGAEVITSDAIECADVIDFINEQTFDLMLTDRFIPPDVIKCVEEKGAPVVSSNWIIHVRDHIKTLLCIRAMRILFTDDDCWRRMGAHNSAFLILAIGIDVRTSIQSQLTSGSFGVVLNVQFMFICTNATKIRSLHLILFDI